jgi:hypothetical protein
MTWRSLGNSTPDEAAIPSRYELLSLAFRERAISSRKTKHNRSIFALVLMTPSPFEAGVVTAGRAAANNEGAQTV